MSAKKGAQAARAAQEAAATEKREAQHSLFKVISGRLIWAAVILIPLGVFISWMGDDDVPSTQVGMHDSNTIARNLAQAKLRAEEEEVARLTKAVSSQLPTAITVPHCDQGMSAPVVIPAGWHLRSGWGGASIKVEYLNNGDWKVATQTNIREAVEAFRYCTPSKSNASIGRMPLTWKRS